MILKVKNEIENLKLVVAVAHNVKIEPSSLEFSSLLNGLISERKMDINPEIKTAIRNLLRQGGFKPSGRNKPANEYLWNAAREDNFPLISNVVDVANYISLLTALPVSLLDLDVLGNNTVIRYGKKNENYVFNFSGQTIDLEGLICICREENNSITTPLGNPVKDSMEAKISKETKSIAGFIYSPLNLFPSEILFDYGEEFMKLLIKFCHAHDVEDCLC